MPRILIDISRLFYFKLTGRRFTGIDRVGLEYLRHYAGSARAVLTLGPFSSVMSARDSLLAFRMLLGDGSMSRAAAARLIAKAYLNWWARPSVEGCVLLNTSHSGLEKNGYASGLRRRGACAIFFVHDLIPITHPQYCRPGEEARHVARIRNAATAGRGMIVPSQHTLDTLRRFCSDAGLSFPPAVVAPLASSLPQIEPGARPMAQPYFVVVGTIERRKNHGVLLQVWRGLIERHGDAAPRLVVIGQRGWGCEAMSGLLDESPRMRGFVVERGDCSDRELVTYLRHAQALLFPSFVEGYGLPLAEALALGVPVVASDLAVFREVAGRVPDYADPLDSRRWTELVSDYSLPHSVLRAAQLERMAGFRATTWREHFQGVDAFLRSL